MESNIGKYSADVANAAAELEKNNVVERIWRKDHTVWKPDPTEISNRLGWLTVNDLVLENLPAMEKLAKEVREAGYQHVVLLGMGGSSLGTEVLRQTFGSAPGYPELIVLDSIIPARIQEVTSAINPEKTLFLVSSKSGTTIEPLSLMKYFQNLIATTTGNKKTGRNFAAITDAGTYLAELAETEGFRYVSLNPEDVGGRYSVLSYFGMVPAALMGVDIASLLNRANQMRKLCRPGRSICDNAGAYLGTIIATMAKQGRDKLTLVTSPALSGFGLWVEQLIAESLGKEGKGVIPVVGEPLVDPANYGDDRLFIYLRLDDDDNLATDTAVKRIGSGGQPLVTLELKDRLDLGAEFFRWEFATAIAGAILGINPFDQPDVQVAKLATDRTLQEYLTSGKLPDIQTTDSPPQLLNAARPGSYLAIMAYIRQTPETDKIIADLRRRLVEKYHITTTSGYGPRYLHSTGQLHKGGPNSGLILLVTTNHHQTLPIPGKPYPFGTLADAQALGDLQTLLSLKRRVARIHLNRDNLASLSQLTTSLT